MKKGALIFILCLVLLPFASTTHALLFDLDGLGGAGTVIDFDTLDWGVSAALIDDGIPVYDPQTGYPNPFTIYTHAALSAFKKDGSNVSLPSGYELDTDFEVTVVLGFGETPTSATSVSPGSIVTFAYDSTNPVNFFEIYIDEHNADLNLDDDASAGTGFNDGTLIALGVVTSGFGSFYIPNLNSTSLLDNYGTKDSLSGQESVIGSGSTTITALTEATNINRDYFLNIPSDFYFSLLDTSNNALPFNQVDPANNFWNGSGYISGIGGTGDIQLGTVNGLGGPDMLLQTDGSTKVNVVPEPATLTLMGMGLMGFAGWGRKRRTEKKR